MIFTHGGETYAVRHRQHRVELYRRTPTTVRGRHRWELDHGKRITKGLTPADAANAMRLYVKGEMTDDEYDRILPDD